MINKRGTSAFREAVTSKMPWESNHLNLLLKIKYLLCVADTANCLNQHSSTTSSLTSYTLEVRRQKTTFPRIPCS